MLAFRGSDDMYDLAIERFVLDAPINCGIGHVVVPNIKQGLCADFKSVHNAINYSRFDTCTSLTVTGHSAGGAFAEFFAYLVNKRDSPIPFASNLKVDNLYAFAPTPISLEPLENEQSSTKCFEGGRYHNLGQVWKESKFDYEEVVDFAVMFKSELGFKHPYIKAYGFKDSARVEQWSCSESPQHPGGSTNPSTSLSKPFSCIPNLASCRMSVELHSAETYVQNFGNGD